jgi:putative acetyltransferase
MVAGFAPALSASAPDRNTTVLRLRRRRGQTHVGQLCSSLVRPSATVATTRFIRRAIRASACDEPRTVGPVLFGSTKVDAYTPAESLLYIRIDNLSGRKIRELLEEHLASMRRHSPPESVHALPIEGLRKPEVTFWTVWEDGELLGCGALKELDAEHGEIKSMRTSSQHLRRGVAATMLRHIIREAALRGYRRLSLETGSMEAFDPARQLYAGAGFTFCGPFADYVEDPNSVFMTKEL